MKEAAAINKSSSYSSSKPSTPTSTQATLVQLVEKTKQYEKHDKKWQMLTDSVSKCICMDMLPVYTVEKKGFCNMLKTFNPHCELPGRKYFSKTAIPSL